MFFVRLAPVAGLLFKVDLEVIREDRSSALSECRDHSTGKDNVSQKRGATLAQNRLQGDRLCAKWACSGAGGERIAGVCDILTHILLC